MGRRRVETVVVVALGALALAGCPPEPAGPKNPQPAPPTPAPAPPTPGPEAPPPAPPEPPAPQASWIGLVYGGTREPGPGGAGIIVRNVVPASPAQEAGLSPGEGIVLVEGREAPGPDYLQGVLDQKRPGDTLGLQVVGADGARRDVTIKVIGFDTKVLGARAIAKGGGFVAARLRGGGWVRKGSEELGVDVALSALCTRALAALPAEARQGHAAVIDSAVGTLLAHKTPEGGIVGAPDRVHHRTYATTLTLQALAVLADPARKADVEALRAFLVKVQLDDDDGITDYDFARYGAWNYFDHNRPATIRADVSATAYAAQALARAGLALDSATVTKALGFLERAQNLPKEGLPAEELALLDGGFAFGPRDSKAGRRVFSSGRIVFRSYGSATADGLRALLWFGVGKDDPRVKAALGWLARNFTLRVNPGFPAEGDGVLERGIFYYYLDALTDALARSGADTLSVSEGQPPIRWRDEVARRLVSLQRPDGSWAGDVAVMNEDDPAQATSFALLALTRCVGGAP